MIFLGGCEVNGDEYEFSIYNFFQDEEMGRYLYFSWNLQPIHCANYHRSKAATCARFALFLTMLSRLRKSEIQAHLPSCVMRLN